jgi:ABC-type transport system involved in multi-copper enzyme maturation permease subunit
MIVLPVIQRELAASARQTSTYSSRTAGAAALLAVCAYVELKNQFGAGFGAVLFAELHGALLAAIWLFVPMLIADCISRERRDGTLALLVLTALRPRDIVIAKGLTQSLRALTLCLAALPVLTIPFLLGGVSGRQVIASVSSALSSLCLVTGTTLLASSLCKSWTRAISLAMMLSALSFWLVIQVFGFQVLTAGGVTAVFASSGVTITAPLAAKVSMSSLMFPICSVALLLLLIAMAARNVSRAAREEPPTARMSALHRRFFTPVFFTGTMKRWLKWELNRNPIGWLEQRSWVNRLVIWSWFAILTCIYTWFFSNFSFLVHNFIPLQTTLAWLMAGSMAATAAGSFRRERETGVMELLLVAPMNEWFIVFGRLRGIWTQFAPSVILMCAMWICWLVLLRSPYYEEFSLWTIAYFVSLFVTLPVAGLYYSLKTSNFIGALLRTLVVGILIPALLALSVGFLSALLDGPKASSFQPLILLFHGGFAVLFLRLLQRDLKLRRFVVPAK